MPAVLLAIWTAFISFITFIATTWIKVVSWLIPILYNFFKRSSKILFILAFWGIFLNLTTTLLAFLLYHINLTIWVALSNFVTSFTVNLLSYYILWIIFLIIWKVFYKLINN